MDPDISPYCDVLLWTSLSFLKANQQKCVEHILSRSTPLFTRNHPKLCFWLRRECLQTPSTEQLIHKTEKKKKQSVEVFCKNFAILTGKHLCQSFLLIKLSAFRPATLLERDSNTGVSLFLDSNITKIPVVFKIEL